MYDAERLYNLLPAIYRLRDAEQGYPLRALMSVIATQSLALEENLAQLYDDQFVETAAEWAIPYIGDLIGVRGIYSGVSQATSARAEVANTIAYRRRKGTAAVLEQLARDVTSWPARAVEFFQLLKTTQYANHIRLDNAATPDLRRWETLERLSTPFTTTARTAEVRRIAPARGRYNIPNVGIFLYRIGAYSLTDAPAAKLNSDPGDARYFFDPLGRDTQLYADPVSEDEITQLAQPINVPLPISRRVLDEYLGDYYGPGRSLFVVTDAEVDIARVVACDLSDVAGGGWAHQPAGPDQVLIDPVLGRLFLGSVPAQGPHVTFHYGFSADMGGGEYARADTFDPDLPVTEVPAGTAIQSVLNAIVAGGQSGAIQVNGSGRYDETLVINLQADQRIELRAGDESRPLLVQSGEMAISGQPGSELALNGFLIAGGAIHISGPVRQVTLRHCALVPGGAPALHVDSTDTTLLIDHSIVGAIRAVKGSEVRVDDSIVDATSETRVAYAAEDDVSAGGALTIVDSTFIGKIHADQLPLVSNAILLAALEPGDTWPHGPARSERTQEGCVRFSYVPPGSHVPRRFNCQPESDEIAARVRPQFTSLRYGDPAYGQLSLRADARIRTGADDESEMGAFHDLYQPQRETNLRVRLDEYLRFGLEAGVFYAS
jgi:hypothetical protein